jgi:hypothetical protein
VWWDQIVNAMLRVNLKIVKIEANFESLHLLDQALSRWRPELGGIDWRKYASFPFSQDDRATVVSLWHMVALMYGHEYLRWRLARGTEILEGLSGGELLFAATYFTRKRVAASKEAHATLEVLLHYGVSPNCSSNNPRHDDISVLGICVLAATRNESFREWWPLLETFLKFGPDAPCWFRYPGGTDGYRASKVIVTFGTRSFSLKNEPLSKSLCDSSIVYDEPFKWHPKKIPECLKAEGGRATLRDFFELEFPDSEVPAILETATATLNSTINEALGEGTSPRTNEEVLPETQVMPASHSTVRTHLTAVLSNPAVPWLLVGK